MKRTLGILLTAVLMVGLVSGCGGDTDPGTSGDGGGGGEAKTITIKLANIYGEDMTETKSMYEFKKAVEERSGGSIQVDVYPNCQLGSEEALGDGIRQGTVEMAILGGALQTHMPYVGLAEFPFLFRDWDHAKKALHDPDIMAALSTGAEDIGITPLGICPSGFRAISSNQAFHSLSDMKGMRLRVPNIPLYVTMAENLGVNVVALPMTELFTALEQKVCDGQEVSPSICRANKYYEVQSAYLVSRHMFTVHTWYINSKFFASLTADQQAILSECAADAIAFDWGIAEQEENDNLKFFEEYGLEVVYPDEAFVQEMRDSQIPTRAWAEEQWPGCLEIIEKIEVVQ
ncbi:TRAP transporter substrate-binding protein [uncultured Oscillibacter sp.]|uniref:TRAP transporter substrate-binding protein n=2 Tax=uncultured Oscillibacter sp. TaxID=876091 RepID=UPI002805AB99|nr:TRAP transporter substrate-binding protein [uncultured Oscillibacter sp.]